MVTSDELRVALDTEFRGTDDVPGVVLFQENKDGDNLSPFLQIFRKQHVIELEFLYNTIQEQLEDIACHGRISKLNV